MSILQCLVCPIHNIPVELLSFIFLLASDGALRQYDDDTDEEKSAFPNAESIKVPVVFSSVCRRWRKVAQSNGQLWTGIFVSSEMIFNECGKQDSVIHTGHLDVSLRLSKNYPLEIVIFGRDYNWNLSEKGMPVYPIDDDFEDPDDPLDDPYEPPFSVAHMLTIVGILLPHIACWRSLTILTDTWAPMHAALQCIQPVILTIGAPRLEALTLMRCNQYVSYGAVFEPHDLQHPTFLSHNPLDCIRPSLSAHPDLLPRLQTLTLSGVHVDWRGLSNILSKNGVQALTTLVLSYHAWNVRPNVSEFHHLLSVVAPYLCKLVLTGSGPSVTEDEDEANYSITNRTFDPVVFLKLRELKIGYRSEYEAHIVLAFVRAPDLHTLGLEDESHPCESDDPDAGGLLSHIIGRSVPGAAAAAASVDVRCYNSPLLGTVPEPHLIRGPPASDATLPSLEKVALANVKCSPRILRAFFNSLPNLRELELSQMSMQQVRALIPSVCWAGQNQPMCSSRLEVCGYPCPLLSTLRISVYEELNVDDMSFLMGSLVVERQKGSGSGCVKLQELNIRVGGFAANDEGGRWLPAQGKVIISEKDGTRIKVQKVAPMLEEEYIDEGNWW